MRELYDSGAYAEKNPTWHEEDSPWKAQHVANILQRNQIQFNTLCEIGCGAGEILLNLERSFPHTQQFGYEISPQAFDRLAAKQTERTKFCLSDVFSDDSLIFDVILAIDVMEHVEDYVSFLKQLKRHGTYKVFHIPLDLSAQSVMRSRPLMNLRRNVGHLHYFYKESALAALTDCGYTVIDYVYTASRLELPNQALSSKLMKIPRRLLFALNADITVRVLGGYSLMVLAQ